jgi:hypothetical protein
LKTDRGRIPFQLEIAGPQKTKITGLKINYERIILIPLSEQIEDIDDDLR